MMINKITPSVDQNYCLGRLDTVKFEPTIQAYLTKVPKVLSHK